MKLPVGYVPGVGVKKATGYGGFGQKMLEKMGWKNGDGLGRTRQGMTEAVEVKKKEDNAGVGANAGWDWSLKQWEAAYNSAVQAVQAHDSDSSSSSDSEVSSDDDEPALDGLIHRDGTAAATSKEELALAFELAKDNPWGRFGGRDGKMARIRRQEEIQANQARTLLGLKASSTAAVPGTARPGSTAAVPSTAAVQPGSTAGLGASTSAHDDSTAQTASAGGRVAVKSKTATVAGGSVGSDVGQQGGKKEEAKKKKKGSKRKLDTDQEEDRQAVEVAVEQEAGSCAAVGSGGSDVARQGGKGKEARQGGKGKEEKKKKKESKRKLDSEQEDGRLVDKTEEDTGGQVVGNQKKKRKKVACDDSEQQQQKQEQQLQQKQEQQLQQKQEQLQQKQRNLGGGEQQQQQKAAMETQTSLQQDPDRKQGIDSALGKTVSFNRVETKQKQQQPAAVSGCPPDWWGHKWFVSAGTLPGMEDEVVKGKVERQTFNEADQTALYMNTFDKQSKGKKGLGERKIKIAGGNWEGTKVRFTDDADQATVQEQSAPSVGVSGEHPNERPSHLSSSNSPAQEPASIPWVKLAKRCLKKAPDQQLKWKALWSAVKERIKAEGLEWKGGKEMLQKKVAGCGRFVVDGKVVKLKV